MAKETDTFSKLLALDVGKHIERKGKFSYLSWSYAVAELRKADSSATWEVRRFPQADAPHVLWPYLVTPAGCFVEVAVTVGGVTLAQVHPVLDERNGTIKAPTADQINKSIMRCLVKAIALHGLGLYIYAGEDVPDALGDDDKVDAGPSLKQQAEADLRKAIGAELDRIGVMDPKARRDTVVQVLGRAPDTVADLGEVLATIKTYAKKEGAK